MISAYIVHCLDSIIPILTKSKLSRLACLCRWSQTQVFSTRGSFVLAISALCYIGSPIFHLSVVHSSVRQHATCTLVSTMFLTRKPLKLRCLCVWLQILQIMYTSTEGMFLTLTFGLNLCHGRHDPPSPRELHLLYKKFWSFLVAALKKYMTCCYSSFTKPWKFILVFCYTKKNVCFFQ